MIEYFADNLWQMWTLIAIVCLIVELTNGDFYVMCFPLVRCLRFLSRCLCRVFICSFSCFAVFGVVHILCASVCHKVSAWQP